MSPAIGCSRGRWCPHGGRCHGCWPAGSCQACTRHLLRAASTPRAHLVRSAPCARARSRTWARPRSRCSRWSGWPHRKRRYAGTAGRRCRPCRRPGHCHRWRRRHACPGVAAKGGRRCSRCRSTPPRHGSRRRPGGHPARPGSSSSPRPDSGRTGGCRRCSVAHPPSRQPGCGRRFRGRTQTGPCSTRPSAARCRTGRRTSPHCCCRRPNCLRLFSTA
ncbi:hypothetical protein D3C80_1357290 [compost metagenome]